MAETLAVTDMLPNKFEPLRKHRWLIAIEGIDAFLLKKGARPKYTSTSTEIDWINVRRYIAGKHIFEPITLELHDPIAPSGAQQTMEWLRLCTEHVSGRAGYSDFYKRDLQLKMLDPVGTVVQLWDLKGCFPEAADYGDLDYTSTDIAGITLTVRFDIGVLQF